MDTPPQSYRRTQFGRVIAASCLPGLVPVVVLVYYVRTPAVNWVAAAIVGFLVLVLLLFGSLAVEISGGHVRIRFGIGLIRKRWALDGIEGCRPVRNTWLYGWGIRKIPGAWLYNVSGLDAVELKLEEREDGPHRHRRAAGAVRRPREGTVGPDAGRPAGLSQVSRPSKSRRPPATLRIPRVPDRGPPAPPGAGASGEHRRQPSPRAPPSGSGSR